MQHDSRQIFYIISNVEFIYTYGRLFIHNCRNHSSQCLNNYLTAKKTKETREHLIKLIQGEYFQENIKNHQNQNKIKKRS